MADRIHETEVAHYEGELFELARSIGRMRYDRVAVFFQALSAEFARQAEGDFGRGRTQLGRKLEAMVRQMDLAQEDMTKIWKLCEPYAQADLLHEAQAKEKAQPPKT